MSDAGGAFGGAILVTGGLGRLGTAVAEALERRGADVVVTSRDTAKVGAYNAAAESSGRRARARLLRFADEAEVDAFVEAALAEIGPIAGLVNNAYAALPYRDVDSVGWRDWAAAAQGELGQPLSLAAALVRRRERSAIRSIVNVASIYGVMAPDFSIYEPGRDPSPITYGAMKAGLLQMTRYLAVLWAKDGVRVNAVSPGGIFDDQDPGFVERYARMVPAGRMVDRREVAGAICFLLGPESAGMTGVNLMVDGGRHAW